MDFETTLDNDMGSGLELTGDSKSYLKESAKWAKFIGIIGFVYIGLMLIMLIGFGSVLSMLATGAPLGGEATAGYAILFFYIAMIFIMVFFPSYYNFLFGKKMQSALESNNSTEITESFKKLKSNYKFWGILILIYIVISIVMLIASFVLGTAFL